MESCRTVSCAGQSADSCSDIDSEQDSVANFNAAPNEDARSFRNTETYVNSYVDKNSNSYKDAYSMNEKSFQDYYPDHMAHCYGCGRLNEDGHQIKSYWEGDESVAHFQPEPYHISIPGYVYGGLLASLIDCHGTGTAAAAGYRAESRPMDSEPPLRYLTASLHVEYLKPTPLGPMLEIRGKVKEVKGRKVVIEEWIVANGEVTVRGEVVAVQVPDSLVQELLSARK